MNQYTLGKLFAADAAAPLVEQLATTQEGLSEAVTTVEFYIELGVIAASLFLALVVGKLLQRYVQNYLFIHPPQRIDAEFITKPLSLIGPILAMLYLSVAKPIVERYAHSSSWIDSITQLCFFYILAKAVVLVLRGRPIGYFIAAVIMIIALLDVTGFMKSTTVYLNSMAFEIGKFKISALNLIHGLVILVIVFWMAGLLSRTLESYLRRSSGLSYSARELIVKFFKIFIYFVALLITLSAIGVDLTAFAVFGGALGVGIGLGLQKITANFVSGITLLVEKSIKLGDLIEVGGMTGWVRALNIRYALVETADGRELLIPNEQLISTQVTNWTHSNEEARVEIKITLDHKTDARRAIALMLECAKAHKRTIKKPEPTCWLREFNDSGLLFMLTFWIADVHDGRNGPQSDVMLVLLERFRAEGIELAERKE
ncbi:MAG: hypothetical protein EBR02_02730 [Alphaproteobacteria bacterium]|nr:hypothetical protein [Alphaproteobacteria bacterium]